MKFLIAVVLVLATGMSVESRGRIFGGSVADPTKFDFLVKITVPISKTRAFTCGGSLISYSWCLTAAHCFDAGDKYNTEVSIGLNKYHQFTEHVKAIEVITHKAYHVDNTTVFNDIAVVKIPNVVKLGQIQSIYLARWRNLVGEIVTVPGLGLIDISSIPSKLQVTSVMVMDDSGCLSMLGHSYRSTQFCTLNSESSTCSGDSGGPVITGEGLNVEQIGIVSYGLNVNCSAGNPSGYTRVASYLQWIKEITGLRVT